MRHQIAKVDDLTKLIGCNNHLVVRFDQDMVSQKTESGLILSGWDVEGDEDEANHATRTGVVISVPKLTLAKKPNDGGIEWGTTNQVDVGDIVVFTAMSFFNSVIIEDEARRGIRINYSDLICAYRNGIFIPLNGICIVDLVEEEDHHSWLITSHTRKTSRKKGKVKVVGASNSYYLGAPDLFDVDIEVGDVVTTRKELVNRLESYNGDKSKCRFNPNLGYIQKRWIITID